MPVSITLTFDTAAEAIEHLSQFGQGEAGTEGAAKPRGPGRPKKAPDTSAPQGAAAVAAAQPGAVASTTAATPAAPAVDFKAVADVITELAEADHPAAVALLGKYGAQNARGLKPEQYGAFVTEARQKLAPAAAASSLI